MQVAQVLALRGVQVALAVSGASGAIAQKPSDELRLEKSVQELPLKLSDEQIRFPEPYCLESQGTSYRTNIAAIWWLWIRSLSAPSRASSGFICNRCDRLLFPLCLGASLPTEDFNWQPKSRPYSRAHCQMITIIVQLAEVRPAQPYMPPQTRFYCTLF